MRNIKYLVISLILGAAAIFAAAQFLPNFRKTPPPQKKAEETQVTFIEGWTVKDDAAALEKKDLISEKDFIEGLKAYDRSTYPWIPGAKSSAYLEGYLFPD